ncbi:MAG: flagellar assembly peptidoglycan hydrolase FlgJ [Pseudomonadota bacterium]|jgi:flagellar protein FlgJ
MATSPLPNRLAVDGRSAQDVREQLQKDPKAGLSAAAQQFESMFLQMVLKSMRDTVPDDGMLNSDSTKFYTSMLDQQLAQNLSGSGSLGFARMIERQLGANLEAANPAANPAASAAAGGNSLAAAGNAGQAATLQALAGQRLQAMVASSAASATSASSGDSGNNNRDFVNRIWSGAVEASRNTGIPPHFIVGHAALESGWGRSEPRLPDGSNSYNLFGIKAGKNWKGASVEATTTEYINGEPQKVTERFRAYGSYAEAFNDYAQLLRNNGRYSAVIGSQDGTEFARRLQQAGYATDPQYADKLARIINGPTLRQALIG